MASKYPPRKKDDEKRKNRDLKTRTAAKRYLEVQEKVKRRPVYGNSWIASYTVGPHSTALDRKSTRDFNKAKRRSKWEEVKRYSGIGTPGSIRDDDRRIAAIRAGRREFEQEAGERRRQRAIGEKVRGRKQARFLATEKKPSAARARKTKRRER
jgi:hypothetical protein